MALHQAPDAVDRLLAMRWRAPLAILAACLAVLITLFRQDVGDMAYIWWNSSTFGHCLFILPIVGWLIVQRWPEVSPLCPQSWAPGLLFVALAALLWVVGEAAAVALIRHVAFILLVQSTVLTILGPAVTRALLFPLFYLGFLVPFGEELVPPMQTLTAKMCMVLLGWVGIPATLDGIFITISTGLFKVAEACSGVKFLVAMFAYGVLVTNVCFRSWKRRGVFLALAILIPILANGLRAFGTIYISHLTDISFAAGFDHVFYGWFFFGIVMVLVMAVGWTFFDRKIYDPWQIRSDLPFTPGKWPSMPLATAIVSIGVLAYVWQGVIIPSRRETLVQQIHLPEVAGWSRQPAVQRYVWTPRFDGGDHYLIGQYANEKGQRVDLAVVVFAWQGEGRELTGYGQGAYDPDSPWAWTNDLHAPPGGRAVRIMAPGKISRDVMLFYGVGGETTGSARAVKLATLKAKLFGGDQSAVAIVISAENTAGLPARPALDAFLKSLGPVEKLAETTVRAARGS